MPARAASTVAEVIARMRAVEVTAARSDGVACFARLYRQVTEGVSAEFGGNGFANPQFLERLDVRFANLFFSALETFEQDPARTPSAWQPLFSGQSRRGIAPLQFALAGMNAHINRDLPLALVATCEELGLELPGGARWRAARPSLRRSRRRTPPVRRRCRHESATP